MPTRSADQNARHGLHRASMLGFTHLDAAVLLVAERLVEFGSVLERRAMGDDEGRIDVALLDPLQELAAGSAAPGSAPCGRSGRG